jgi:hypothetical protein
VPEELSHTSRIIHVNAGVGRPPGSTPGLPLPSIGSRLAHGCGTYVKEGILVNSATIWSVQRAVS